MKEHIRQCIECDDGQYGSKVSVGMTVVKLHGSKLYTLRAIAAVQCGSVVDGSIQSTRTETFDVNPTNGAIMLVDARSR